MLDCALANGIMMRINAGNANFTLRRLDEKTSHSVSLTADVDW
jgi:hypothetical protein